MTQLPAAPNPDLHREIDALAREYRRAAGPVMALMQRLGGTVEHQLTRLPAPIRAQIERGVISALTGAHHLAAQTEGGPNLGRGGVMLAAMASGAAGGSGGLATSLVELPVTVTVFLHAIRAEARAAGFDPDEAGIRAACLEVFTAATPLAEDDGMNTAFLSARMAVTGAALHKVIATVAPRLALILGQKLAAQTVPVLGAASGAAINAAYLRYFREIARIRFALMRLAQAHGGEVVAGEFARAATPKITRAG
ncbi:MAG: EcsC family protein [Cypionkella sp.]|nr:EcsC family protein [Cypionkella sp.]